MGVLSSPRKALLNICPWTRSACSFPFLPSALVIRVTDYSLVWFCSQGFIMEASSDIKLRCLPLWLQKNTQWKKTGCSLKMIQTQILTQMPKRKDSHHAGLGDRLRTLHIPEKKTRFTLARKAGALDEQPCRKLMCRAHQICR